MGLTNQQITALKGLLEPAQNSPDFSRLSGELKNKMLKWDKEGEKKM